MGIFERLWQCFALSRFPWEMFASSYEICIEILSFTDVCFKQCCASLHLHMRNHNNVLHLTDFFNFWNTNICHISLIFVSTKSFSCHFLSLWEIVTVFCIYKIALLTCIFVSDPNRLSVLSPSVCVQLPSTWLWDVKCAWVHRSIRSLSQTILVIKWFFCLQAKYMIL